MNTTSTIHYEHKLNNSLSSPFIETINQENLPPYIFQDNINTICIKATVGLGKTNALYDFINKKLKKDYHSCLIISFRRSLCKKYHEDLTYFSHYNNITTSDIDSDIYPYVICQIDSLRRIRGHYDLVIFDEFTYTMKHLVESVENKARCFNVFKQLMYDENHMIFMDALFNNDWINYIQIFNRKIHYIINDFSIHSDKKICNYGTNITEFEKQIRVSIDKKENIVIATNNKKMLNYIDNMLVNNYKNVSKLMIKRENKTMYDLEQWKHVQVLGYTPSIVAGISFTEKHFNKCFGLFCNASSTADMAFQQLFRVRDISSGEYHICCEIKGKKDFPETDEEIKNLILKEDKCLISGLENINIDYIKKDIIEDEYFKLFNIVQKNKFLCNNNYNKMLIDIFNEQGITNIKEIKHFDKNDKKALLASRREFNKKIKEEDAERTANAPDCTEDEIQNIKDKKEKTDDDSYILKKDSLKKRLKIKEITKETILKFGKKGRPLWNLAYINSYDDFKTQILKRIKYDEINLDINGDITTRLGRDRKYEILYLCIHMLNYFGFSSPFDSNKIDIDKNKFKNYIIKYKDIIEGYFRCNSFNVDIFNNDVKDWYKTSKIYINSKLKSVLNISINDDKKVKKWYIQGIGFWDDKVTYKNVDIINEIKENEIKLFDKIDEQYKNKKKYDDIVDFVNGNIGFDVLKNLHGIEEQDDIPLDNYYDDVGIKPDEYHEDYKNKNNKKENKNTKCIKCDNNVINGNTLCIKCKFKRF